MWRCDGLERFCVPCKWECLRSSKHGRAFHLGTCNTWVHKRVIIYDYGSMIKEKQQLITNEQVEFEKQPIDIQDCMKITNHFRAIYRIYPYLIKDNRNDVNTRISTLWSLLWITQYKLNSDFIFFLYLMSSDYIVNFLTVWTMWNMYIIFKQRCACIEDYEKLGWIIEIFLPTNVRGLFFARIFFPCTHVMVLPSYLLRVWYMYFLLFLSYTFICRIGVPTIAHLHIGWKLCSEVDGKEMKQKQKPTNYASISSCAPYNWAPNQATLQQSYKINGRNLWSGRTGS